jgi:hypothetical protein
MPDDESHSSTAPLDFDILDRLGHRLEGSARFSDVVFRPAYAPDSVVVEYDLGYFPAGVDRAYMRIRWYANDDFSVHYSEQYENGSHWECRWDRHPNSHNSRNHFHPPPAAETPGTDQEYPRDWREMLAFVLRELDARIEAFWE